MKPPAWGPLGLAALGWLVLLAAALAAAGGAASHPGGLWIGLPSTPYAGLMLGLVVLIIAAAGFAHGRLALGLAPLLVLPAVAPSLACVRALSGPPLFVPVLAVLVCLAARRAPAWLPLAQHALFPLVLLVYSVTALQVQRQVGAEGDEPHYLMVAESLLRDHDLALEQDYAEGRYRAFYRTQPTLAPHYLVRGLGGEIYSQHALGLSLLVLPAYALGGYPAASLLMALLAALLVLETRGLLREWTGDAALAEGVAWVLALSPPLVHFAGLVFTEIPAALVLALGLRRLRAPHRMGPLATLGVGAALAFVPWLNVRYAPFTAVLLAFGLTARPRLSRASALALVAPALFSAAASALYHHRLYGFFDPRRVYGRRPGFAWTRLPSGLEALLFDQEFGLLVYAPVFVLALAGLAVLARRMGPRRALALAVPILIMLGIAATWRMWWGGWTPPARFLVPIVPALGVLVALALRRGVTAASALLIGWGLFMGLAAVPQPGLVHRDRDGTAPLLRSVSGAKEWTGLLPRYVVPDADPQRRRLTLVWVVALGTVVVAASGRRRVPSGWGVAGVSLGLLLAAEAAARVGPPGVAAGRDAVRLLGRPALKLPGWRVSANADAVWGPEALDWGALYEAHRFPSGAALGARLPLSPGRYRLALQADALPGAAVPLAGVVPDKAPVTAASRVVLAPTPTGWAGEFILAGPVAAWDLRLLGGGPLVVREVSLRFNPP